MFVINGKIITIPDALKSLLPENIDRINVLKGASAVTLYGAEGVNGVVEIFTKSKPLSQLKETTETVKCNHLGEIVLVAPKQNGEEKEAMSQFLQWLKITQHFPVEILPGKDI